MDPLNPNPPESQDIVSPQSGSNVTPVPAVTLDPMSRPFLVTAVTESAHGPAASRERESLLDLWDAALVIVAAFLAIMFTNTLAAVIYYIAHRPRPFASSDLMHNALFLVPAQVAGYLFTVGFMTALAWVRHRQGLFEAVKWNPPPSDEIMRWLGLGAGLGAFSLVSSTLLQRWIPKTLPIDELFRTTSAAYLLSAFGILVAPLVEELFFRGFLFPALSKVIGVTASVILTALSFALLHSEQLAKAWAPLMVLFVIGTALTLVRARTRSVARCVLVHMGYNSILFATMFIVTRGFTHLEKM